MTGSRSVQITDQQIHSATYYAATTEDIRGLHSIRSMEIRCADPQGVLDW
jgi:hypothetical protein